MQVLESYVEVKLIELLKLTFLLSVFFIILRIILAQVLGAFLGFEWSFAQELPFIFTLQFFVSIEDLALINTLTISITYTVFFIAFVFMITQLYQGKRMYLFFDLLFLAIVAAFIQFLSYLIASFIGQPLVELRAAFLILPLFSIAIFLFIQYRRPFLDFY